MKKANSTVITGLGVAISLLASTAFAAPQSGDAIKDGVVIKRAVATQMHARSIGQSGVKWDRSATSSSSDREQKLAVKATAIRWDSLSEETARSSIGSEASTDELYAVKGFRWGVRSTADQQGFRWGVRSTADQQGFRWGVRSTADQQGFRWGVRSTADQQGFRWGVRSTADQQGFRWGVRSTADQQGFRWGVRSTADQQGFRWGVRSTADQQGFRWGVRSTADQQGFRWGVR